MWFDVFELGSALCTQELHFGVFSKGNGGDPFFKCRIVAWHQGDSGCKQLSTKYILTPL